MTTKNPTKKFMREQAIRTALGGSVDKIMLIGDTHWINDTWDKIYDCEWKALRNEILEVNDENIAERPYMLYKGTREQRHELHKKLGSNFSHTSVDMDDGSRVMVIQNKQ